MIERAPTSALISSPSGWRPAYCSGANLINRRGRIVANVAASIHEGLDEMLTVIHLGLPDEQGQSPDCTNVIESLMAVLQQVYRNVKRWRDARMALRWTGTAMLEAEKPAL
jgi:hypothetical protein